MLSARPWLPAILAVTLLSTASSTLRAQTAAADSAEFVAWRKVQQEDIDGLHKKFMALAKALSPAQLSWRPMDGTRSFREVFAHIAAEGNTETAMFGRPLPAGSLADFDAEEARVKNLKDDQVLAAMDRSLDALSATMGGLSRSNINAPIKYYGESTLPRIAVTYTLNDLHEHLGQLVAYLRMNKIVPPWSKKS